MADGKFLKRVRSGLFEKGEKWAVAIYRSAVNSNCHLFSCPVMALKQMG